MPIKDKYSPSYRLGKLLYPRRAPWEQRRKGLLFIMTVAISLMLGLALAYFILRNYRRG